MFKKSTMSQLLDGSLKDCGASLCAGTFRGYHTKITASQGAIYSITFEASSENDPGNAALFDFLMRLREEEKAVINTAVQPYSCSLAVKSAIGKVVENFNRICERVTGFLEAGGYHTGCSVCGRDAEDVECYTVNGSPVFQCGQCIASLDASLQEEQERITSDKSNVGPGIVGALGGALIGAVAWVLIYKLGYIAGIAGFLVAMLAFKGYEKLGGCLDKKGAVLSLLVSAVVIALANKLAWAWDAAVALKEYGWTFFDCFRDLDYILEELELRSSYVGDLLLGYFLSLVSSLRMIISTFRSTTGKYKIRKIDLTK